MMKELGNIFERLQSYGTLNTEEMLFYIYSILSMF